jgi:hypothetical protein
MGETVLFPLDPKVFGSGRMIEIKRGFYLGEIRCESGVLCKLKPHIVAEKKDLKTAVEQKKIMNVIHLIPNQLHFEQIFPGIFKGIINVVEMDKYPFVMLG